MKIYLREANKSDCDLLFQWANEELVRKNSFNSDLIKYEEHVNWFENKLNLINCYMYIFYVDGMPAGHVRIDIENKIGLISYSLDKNYRGKGLAADMLNSLERKIHESDIDIERLVGYVKIDNLASRKIFKRLNYSKLIDNGVFKYYKFI